MSGLQQPIMQAHDPNDDPFGDLAPADNSGLVSPMEFGTGEVDPTKETPPPVAAPAAPVAETTHDEKKEDGGK
jgi:hypothetical protein